jgi:hypothetical protein
MKKILRLEEAAMFAAAVMFFPKLGISWWWFTGCILLPDLSMLGYLVNAKVGAYTYNLFHHKALAIIIGVAGIFFNSVILAFIGLILFAHASMDRSFGYGLKYEDGFNSTHLGMIGKADTTL